jgi:hypothetical protein
MATYEDFVARDRRLVILKILGGLSERRANQYVLRPALRSLGYDELAATVHNDILWLRKQGLVRTESLEGGILLAVLTDYGDQVARGVVRVAGVAAPAEE